MSDGQRAPRVVGLVLAAGAGRRMGVPKALLRDAAGEAWAARAARVLREGGCTPVLVTAGPRSDEVAAALGASGAEVVVVPDAATGLSASLRAGLRAATPHDPDLVVVTLVDLPAVDAAAVVSVLDAARAAPGGARAARVRATWRGVPGHPVALGADHLAVAANPPDPARTGAGGGTGGAGGTGTHDTGARALLRPGPGVVLVEQHRDGPDADTPADLPPGTTLPAPARPDPLDVDPLRPDPLSPDPPGPRAPEPRPDGPLRAG